MAPAARVAPAAPLTAKVPSAPWRALVLALDTLHRDLQAACLPRALQRPLYEQLLAHINAALFNRVVSQRERVTLAVGEHCQRGLLHVRLHPCRLAIVCVCVYTLRRGSPRHVLRPFSCPPSVSSTDKPATTSTPPCSSSSGWPPRAPTPWAPPTAPCSPSARRWPSCASPTSPPATSARCRLTRVRASARRSSTASLRGFTTTRPARAPSPNRCSRSCVACSRYRPCRYARPAAPAPGGQSSA